VDPQAGQATERPDVPPTGSLTSLLAACAVLFAVLAPLAIAMACFAYSRSGTIGIVAAAIAGGICWVSASLALVAAFLGQRWNNPIAGILGGTLLRLGLPLAGGLAIQQTQPALAQAGCFTMILGLYLVALVVETALSLKFVPQPRTNVKRELPPPQGGAISSSTMAGGVTGR
jgi:hypothetical protein